MKRFLDLTLSLIAIILLSPLLLIISLGIKLSSKGPIIYKHERMGRYGKIFNNYKFRSMIVGARNQQQKGIKDKELIFPFGQFLRKIHLDELPQLFNILKGDMSFVGPRSMDVEYYRKTTQVLPKWKYIIRAKPGLTCLESVVHELPQDGDKILKKLNLKIKKPYNYFHERLKMDLYYLNHQSFLLDLKLILYTIKLVLVNLLTKNYYKSRAGL